MVCVTEGDPTVVVSAASVRSGASEGRVRFCAEVTFMVGARRFVMSSDLAVVAKGDLVVDSCIIRWG